MRRGADMAGTAHFILYVADQAAATAFWTGVLGQSPSLDAPGMTEFTLTQGTVLGLMPEAGIRALLGPALPDPASGRVYPAASCTWSWMTPASTMPGRWQPERAN